MATFSCKAVQALQEAQPVNRIALRIKQLLQKQLDTCHDQLKAKCNIQDVDRDEIYKAIETELGLPHCELNHRIEFKDTCDCFGRCHSSCQMHHSPHVIVTLKLAEE